MHSSSSISGTVVAHVSTSDRQSRRVGSWLGPLLIAVAGAILLAFTWGTWPDPLTDSGRELYVPWRLCAGERLYVDIAYFNGPLSPYLNALWFKLFGVSMRTLVAANLILLAVLVGLIYRVFRGIAGDVGATAAGLVFVLVFAFGQYSSDIDNYNYALPYSHEATHGLVLAFGGLWFLKRYLERGRVRDVVGMGAAVGLAFLTKPEVFLAAGLAVGAGFVAAMWLKRFSFGHIAIFVISGLAPVVVAWGLLALTMPARTALVGVLGGWPATLNGEVAGLPFYREIMGVLDVRSSLLWLGLSGGVYLAFVAGVGLISAAAVRWPRVPRVVLNMAALLGVMGAGVWMAQHFVDAGRPLPVVVLLIGVLAGRELVRNRNEPAIAVTAVMRLVLSILALVLLLKIVLYARTFHYGIFLGMPAMLLVVAGLMVWYPRWLARRGWDGEIARFAAVGFCVALVAIHLGMSAKQIAVKRNQVGLGGDAFRADGRARQVNEMLDQIERRVESGQTLAVLPEGVMLNYLARRQNPTPYITVMPPEVIMFGQEKMLAAFEAHSPDYLCVVQRDTSEYGCAGFGHGYGEGLYAWVVKNYRPVHQVGVSPVERMAPAGMVLMKRIERP